MRNSLTAPLPNKDHEVCVVVVVVLLRSPPHAPCLTPSTSSGPITPITRQQHESLFAVVNIPHDERLQHFNTIAD